MDQAFGSNILTRSKMQAIKRRQFGHLPSRQLYTHCAVLRVSRKLQRNAWAEGNFFKNHRFNHVDRERKVVEDKGKARLCRGPSGFFQKKVLKIKKRGCGKFVMTVKAPSPVALRCCWVGFWSESLGAEEVSEEKQSGLRRSRCEACSFSFVFYVI